MGNVAPKKVDRFEEVWQAISKTPLGKEMVSLMEERLLEGMFPFSPDTPSSSDKYYLGRHSVYKDLIKISKKPPTKET